MRSTDAGYVAFLDGTEYPDLAGTQAAPDEPPARSVDEAVEQLRRALNRS